MKTYLELIQDTGLYTYRKLNTHSVEFLHEWMRIHSVPNALRPGDLHCTIVQSQTPIEGYTLDPTPVMLDPKTFSVQMLNEALVISFRSDALEEQWQRAMNLGAKYKWAKFIPHISLSYKVPVGFDFKALKPPPAYLILNEEEARPLSTNGFQSFEDEETTPKPIYVPHHSLNVPRENMPQIANINVMEFVDWMEDQGHVVQFLEVPAALLKSAQQGTDITKVATMTLSTGSVALSKPLLISKDNYILDGHHRWLAILNRDPQSIVEAYRINMSFTKLLEMSQTFSKAFYKPSVNQSLTGSYK